MAARSCTVTNKPLSQWAAREGRPENLTVLADVSEKTIIDDIEAAAAKNHIRDR
jgi:chromosome partitioning protein